MPDRLNGMIKGIEDTLKEDRKQVNERNTSALIFRESNEPRYVKELCLLNMDDVTRLRNTMDNVLIVLKEISLQLDSKQDRSQK